MRRENGTVDFYRGFYFYKMGFGDVHGEYYLGEEFRLFNELKTALQATREYIN